MHSLDAIKILTPAALSFAIGIFMTPAWVGFLYRNRLWKKKNVARAMDGGAATISQSLHRDEERKTPRLGGVIIWGSTALSAIILWLCAEASDTVFDKLSFLSRAQTWVPLATLLLGGLFGAIDDYLVCQEGDAGGYAGGGLSLRWRLLFVGLLGFVVAAWFAWKLDVTHVFVPFWGDLELGMLFIPFFIMMIVGIYSGGIIDGIDGLSGGVYASIYAAYTIIAYSEGQLDIAAFTSAVLGGLLAFLWFNIPPARFFSSETGTMALSLTIVVVAFLTNAILVLPVIAFLLVVTSASSLIQILSKRYRKGKKVFLVAPLHNHFQAAGWPATKVTMRYWVLSVVFAVIGVVIALAGRL